MKTWMRITVMDWMKSMNRWHEIEPHKNKMPIPQWGIEIRKNILVTNWQRHLINSSGFTVS